MRQIALIAATTLVEPGEVSRCAAALQTQVSRDFAATWGMNAQLRVTDTPTAEEEVLFLLDDARQAEAHDPFPCERPWGFVFLRPCLETGEAWQSVVSHELLEMLADPLIHLAVAGRYQEAPALFAVEVCDPVAGDGYEIDDVPLANFVLPSWFLARPLRDEILVDFLGRLSDPYTLTPTGCALVGTEVGRWQTWFARRFPRAQRLPAAYSRRRRRLEQAAALAPPAGLPARESRHP